MLKILFLLVLVLSSCTPAKIIYQNHGKNVKTAKVTIVRPDSIKFIFVSSIFGFDGMDIVKLRNNEREIIEVPIGNHEFFIRSNQADRPFKYSHNVKDGEKICFLVKPRLSVAFSLFYFSHAFTIEEDHGQVCNDIPL